MLRSTRKYEGPGPGASPCRGATRLAGPHCRGDVLSRDPIILGELNYFRKSTISRAVDERIFLTFQERFFFPDTRELRRYGGTGHVEYSYSMR